MGLDITAYSHLKFSGDTEYDADDDGESVFVENRAFPERLSGMSEGYYDKTDDTEEYRFGAGSYSTYNSWRRELCETVHGISAESLWENPEAHKDKAFYELINMSDCEGTIGTEVCKKLYQDFLTHADKLKEMDGNSWIKKCNDWTEAFRIGSEGGVVDFH